MAFELLVASAICWFLEDTDWGTILITFLVLHVVYFAIWTKNSIWSWLIFNYTGRKEARDHILTSLKNNNYPEPDDYCGSAEDFYAGVASDSEQPVEVRLNAAMELGTLRSYASSGQYQTAMRVSMAAEDAIEMYKSSFK